MPTILVINPNSNPAVTKGFDEALAPLRLPGGPQILCETLAEGPFGIQSQADVESVALPLARVVAQRPDVDAFIIACYSDPGLFVCREATKRPVLGIAECGLLSAMARGQRFGVIAIARKSIPRHIRYMRQMGILDRLAAERALEMSVAEAASGDQTLARMIQAGRELRDLDGADVVVMGCAGMARHRRGVEAALGIPVIDPVQAAVTMAMGIVAFA
ncbi:MAG: aspartate/glutamate racemase family protein [Bosea sp. (in: a-proteobacteria)]